MFFIEYAQKLIVLSFHFHLLQLEGRLEEKSRQERLGPAVETLADSELFFVDKVIHGHGVCDCRLI